MNEIKIKPKDSENNVKEIISSPVSRRKFLLFSGMTAAALTIGLQACSDDDNMITPGASAIDVGSGDTGVLNYAYALEQLKAAFYVKVVSSFYNGATSEEQQILTDIREHEIAHREFFKAALGGSAIASLDVDFSSIDFSSRSSVLGTAKVFEDLGVAAYNGAAYLIVNPDYLVLAGKIVSVEARHAAAIRDLLNPRSPDFAGDDVIDTSGLDRQMLPSQVIQAANGFLSTKISANNLA